MVYHRLDSGSTSGEAPAPRDDGSSARDESKMSDSARNCDSVKASEGKNSEKWSEGRNSRNGRDDGSRYSRGSRSRDERDDGRYSRSRDDRKDSVREKDRYYESSRYSDRSRYRDGSRYHESGRYDDGPRYSERSRYPDDDTRYPDDSRYDDARYGDDQRYTEGSKYSENSRYPEGSRYSEGSRYRSGRGEDWYREGNNRYSSRYDEDSRYSGESSRNWKGRDQDALPESTSPPPEPEKETVKNVFQNDGSFLEMFKKMKEAAQPAPSQEGTEEVVATVSSEVEQPAVECASVTKKPPMSIVGKRRGGRVLPTGMVKKQKKEEETGETPKDAWSLYMAEVRKYKEASCEEEGKTRSLVKCRRMPSIIPTVEAASKNTSDPEDTPKLETAPFDPRFPNQNQTRYCYQSYIDFHRCHAVKGEDYEPCDYFKKVFRSICPIAWIEKWDQQIEENRFPGKIQ